MTEENVVEFIEVVSAVALRIVVVLSSIVVESDIRTFPSSAAEKRNFWNLFHNDDIWAVPEPQFVKSLIGHSPTSFHVECMY